MNTQTQTTVQPVSTDIDQIVPQLSAELEFYPFDEKNYLIQQKQHSHNLKVSTLTHTMLTYVDGHRTIAEIVSNLQERESVSVQPADVYKVLYQSSLASCGVVQTDQPVAHRRGDAYLRLRLTILNEKVVHGLSRWLTFFFQTPVRFYVLLAVMLSFLTVVFILFENVQTVYKAITPANTIYFYLCMLFGALLHELGHATACRAFGARPGAIGVGFYLFRPVLYADVSDAWKVSARKRVVIDLAGIFMEVLLCTLLGITFLITHQLMYLHVALFIMLSTYANLNPLLRFDGYWALSDSINVPNLRANSLARLTGWFRWLRGQTANPLRTRMDYFLWVYAAVSMAFMVFFLVTVLVYNPQSILYFPYNLLSFFKKIILDIPHVRFSWVKDQVFSFLLPLLFYYLVGNLLYQQWKKRKNIQSKT